MTDAVPQDRFGRVLGLYSTPGLRTGTVASVVFSLDLDLLPSLFIERPDTVVGHFYELTITRRYCLTVNHDGENQTQENQFKHTPYLRTSRKLALIEIS